MMYWSYFGSFPSTMCKDPNIDNDNIALVHFWTIDDMCEKSSPLRSMSEKMGIILLITWNNSLVFSSCYVIIPIALT